VLYGEGISLEGEIIDQGVLLDIVEKSGSWYSYKGEKIGQGKDNARIFLKENPKISNEIEQLVRDNSSITAEIKAAVIPEEDEPNPAE